MIKTPICDMLGIKHPILQGGMPHISDAVLAAGVSNAGGLGIISAASGDVEKIEKEIDKCKELTDKPFGVNIMLMGENIDEIATLLAKKRVAGVTTGAGNPEKYIPMWKEANIKVIPVVASSALAKLVARSGADAVIAEGTESGGHVGEMATMALVPQVADAVDIPVIAAGGIGDGRGIVASLALGAVGVQVGTRFLLASECNISRTYKDKLLKAGDTATIVTGRRLGHPVRSIKTALWREYSRLEYTGEVTDEQLEEMGKGTLRAAVVDGDAKKGCFLAGQIAGLCNKEQTSSEIIEEMFAEADSILNGAEKWVR